MFFMRCDEPERTIMTEAEKEMVDSIYSDVVGKVRKETDSICDARYQEIFDKAADSFYQEYVKEINHMFNREE